MNEIEEQIFMTAYGNARKNTAYVKYINDIMSLERKIMERLGNNRSLLLEFERTVGLAEGIYLESAYRLGLEDGSCPTKCLTDHLEAQL